MTTCNNLVDYEREELEYALSAYDDKSHYYGYPFLNRLHMNNYIWDKYFQPNISGKVNDAKIIKVLEDLKVKFKQKYGPDAKCYNTYDRIDDRYPTANAMIRRIENKVFELIGSPECPKRNGLGLVVTNGKVTYQVRGRYGWHKREVFKEQIEKMHQNPYFIEDNDTADPSMDDMDNLKYAITKFTVSTPIADKIAQYILRLRARNIWFRSDHPTYKYLRVSGSNNGVPDSDPLKNRYIFSSVVISSDTDYYFINIKIGPDLTITDQMVDSLVQEIEDTWIVVN